jgi:acyl carrier protein
MSSVSEIRILLDNLDPTLSFDQARDDESLFDAGYLDSLRLINLTEALQQRYGLRIGPHDLVPDNFETIAAIAGFVSRQSTVADATA